MRVHVDVLGWLFIVCGAFGVLTGLSLGILASGTTAALADLGAAQSSAPPAVWLFIVVGVSLVLAGAAMILSGRAVIRRTLFGRRAVLCLAALNLAVIPFGTALGVYAFWVLLNDDARREFGMTR